PSPRVQRLDSSYERRRERTKSGDGSELTYAHGSKRTGSADLRLRARDLRPPRSRGAIAIRRRLVGRPPHGVDHGRRGAQSPSVSLHRRAAAAALAAGYYPPSARIFHGSECPFASLGAARFALAAREGLGRRLISPDGPLERRAAGPPLHRRRRPP